MKQFLLTGLLLAGLVGTHVCAQNKAKPAAPKPPSSKPANISTGKDLIQTVPDKLYNNLKAGDIAPDVVKIDCDFIRGIKNGAIFIRKGNKEALIDVNGRFLVPWGTYNYMYDFSSNVNALIHVESLDPATRGQNAYLNGKGETVIPLSYKLDAFNSLNIARYETRGFKTHFIDDRGNVFPDDPFSARIGEVGEVDLDLNGRAITPKIFPYMHPIIVKQGSYGGRFGNKYGFADKNGKPVFDDLYDGVGYFREGMAQVLKIDQFGIPKWGFIDETGKLVIPCIYRVRPGNFHEGLALVRSVENADFDCAYIDKTGEIKIKLGTGPHTLPYGANYFTHDYAFWTHYKTNFILLNRQGEFQNLAKIVHVSGIRPNDELFIDSYNAKSITYHLNGSTARNNGNIFGVVDFNGNEVFPAVFNSIQPDYFSSYAWAKVALPNTKNAPVWPSVEGIVNKQGVFVIVIDKKPTF